jgi:hypothetical protein
MSEHCNIEHPLKREGTYQWQRLADGLKDGFFKPDDRKLEDTVMQVARYASLVKYYDSNFNEWGNWEDFFTYIFDYTHKKIKVKNIDALLELGNVPPHLGLMLSFLKTMQAARDSLNEFTHRHLDFYYNKVLQLTKQAPVADRVALVFTPEKNTIQARVEEGRAMKAGKDATGKDLEYITQREIIVNQVIVAKKKSLFAKKDSNLVQALHGSEAADIDNKFSQNNISSWYPFGTTANKKTGIGFALSSPMLYAKEGRRRLSIEIDDAVNIPRASFTAFYTGPKGWVEATVDILPGVGSLGSTEARKFLLVKIDEALPAIAGYVEKTHKSGYAFTHPVIKIIAKNDEHFSDAFTFLSTLKRSSIKKMVLNVEGTKSFTIVGENGKLNPLQAFKPFGSTPVKNKSFFTLGNIETFNKYLKTFHLAANWKMVPGKLLDHYVAYDQFLISRYGFPKVFHTIKKGTTTYYTSFSKDLQSFNQGNVPGKVELLSGGKWVSVPEDSPDHYSKRTAGTYNTFHVGGVIKDTADPSNSNDMTGESRWGFAKVTLGFDFGHQLYTAVLTDTILVNTKQTDVTLIKPVPPPPYTPEFNSLHLDYVLETNLDTATDSEHAFIQLHPFGFSSIVAPDFAMTDPAYAEQGQLFIGLANCTTPQLVNLYIARVDGTEDIDALLNEDPAWYYLQGDSWEKFQYEQLVIDTTNKFTGSGFVSLAIPTKALKPNSIMGENLVWLKLVSATSAAAFPSVLDIHANAVEAIFVDHENDPYHLSMPLPAGTIAKPQIKIDGVKSIAQPYSSYSGTMAEQDEHFFTRVSERLRHKDRAWTIWDYERIILQKFPSIYKIKCLSHAVQHDMYSPGNVLCVALPATANIAEKDLLQPRISKGVLTAAATFLKDSMSPFAAVEVINPIYEMITVSCSVRIKAGFDETFSKGLLSRDLCEYISPWIANKKISPSFGGKIYASAIINFIEERPYVDFLMDFSATRTAESGAETWTEFTMGSSEDVILTSAPQHNIITDGTC